jgi:hypothetical protein
MKAEEVCFTIVHALHEVQRQRHAMRKEESTGNEKNLEDGGWLAVLLRFRWLECDEPNPRRPLSGVALWQGDKDPPCNQ